MLLGFGYGCFDLWRAALLFRFWFVDTFGGCFAVCFVCMLLIADCCLLDLVFRGGFVFRMCNYVLVWVVVGLYCCLWVLIVLVGFVVIVLLVVLVLLLRIGGLGVGLFSCACLLCLLLDFDCILVVVFGICLLAIWVLMMVVSVILFRLCLCDFMVCFGLYRCLLVGDCLCFSWFVLFVLIDLLFDSVAFVCVLRCVGLCGHLYCLDVLRCFVL